MFSWIFFSNKVPGILPDDYPKLYNCGMLWFKNNVKINPSAIYSKRQSLALVCIVLKYGQMKDAFPSVSSESEFIPSSQLSSILWEWQIFFICLAFFFLLFFSLSEVMLRSCFWIFAYFLLCILLKLFSFLFLIFYFSTCGQCKN